MDVQDFSDLPALQGYNLTTPTSLIVNKWTTAISRHLFSCFNTLFFLSTTPQPDATKATDQPDASTKPAEPKPTQPKPPEPDPAEIWKKDFQCQWYKTADGDASYQQPPKDGASVGAKQSAADVTGSTAAASVASTTKGASVTDPTGSASPSTASWKASLEAPTDGGSAPRCAPHLTALPLLLLLTTSLLLEP